MNWKILKLSIHRINGNPITVLVLLWLIFFKNEIFFGKIFYCCDNLLINVPQRIFEISEIKSGRFPLWNPYLFSGVPYLADINLAPLYPLNILYLFLTPFKALTWFILIHCFIGLIGFYLFSRSIKLSTWASVISAVIFGFSGSMMVYTNNTAILSVTVLLPWVLLGWVIFTQNQNRRNYLMLTAITVLQIIAGHPQITYYTFIFGFSYFLIKSKLHWDLKIISILPFLFIVLLISAIQIIPFLEFALNSTRTDSLENAQFGSFNPFFAIKLIIPSLIGDIRRGTSWLQEGSIFGYAGAIPILFIILYFRKIPKVIWFWMVAGCVSFILSLGKFTPLFVLFYDLVPGFGKFRVPSHLLTIWICCMAVVFGSIVDGLFNYKYVLKIRHLFYLVIFILVLGTIDLVSANLLSPQIFSGLIFFGGKLATKMDFLGINGVKIILTSISLNILIIGFFGLLIYFSLKSTKLKKYLYLVCLISVFTELFIYSRYNLLTVHADKIQNLNESLKSYVSKMPEFYPRIDRIYVDPEAYWAPRRKQFGLANDFSETEWQFKILRSNLAMNINFPIINGYGSMIYKPYQKFFGYKETDPTGVNTGPLNSPLYNLLGVRYLVTKAKSSSSSTTKFKPIYRDNDIAIYENLLSYPRFFTTDGSIIADNGITIDKYFPDKVTLSVDLKVTSRLVFTDVNYPGWQAKVDGKLVSITPYKNIFKSVAVPLGKHTVEFEFNPDIVKFGLLLTIIGCGIWIKFALSELIDVKKIHYRN
jgi:hypothetical protein